VLGNLGGIAYAQIVSSLGYAAFGVDPSPQSGASASALPAESSGAVQLVTIAVGFWLAVSMAAMLGDALDHSMIPNAGKRRTTARKRKRGRPTVEPVGSYDDWVKMPEGYVHVQILRGQVYAGSPHSQPSDVVSVTTSVGTVYDAGTTFRSVPSNWDAPVKEFTTLAGAVKHLIRSESA